MKIIVDLGRENKRILILFMNVVKRILKNAMEELKESKIKKEQHYHSHV